MFLNQIPDNCKLTSGNSMNHHQLKSDVSFHFSSEKTLSLVEIVETGKKIRAAGSCCMDQSSYFKCLFRPNNLDFFGRVLSGYQGVIAKIKQFCDRFEILILTQLILKRRHCLRQVLKKSFGLPCLSPPLAVFFFFHHQSSMMTLRRSQQNQFYQLSQILCIL